MEEGVEHIAGMMGMRRSYKILVGKKTLKEKSTWET
jgi:hypothetical protein